MIDSRLRAALGIASKLELRAETAINDGKTSRAIKVLNDLVDHATRKATLVKDLIESLGDSEYSSKDLMDKWESFDAYRISAEERLDQLKETKNE